MLGPYVVVGSIICYSTSGPKVVLIFLSVTYLVFWYYWFASYFGTVVTHPCLILDEVDLMVECARVLERYAHVLYMLRLMCAL